MHKRGMPRVSVEKFWSQNTGKPHSKTILCFRNFLVSNNFMKKRGGGVGTVKIFCRKFFVAQCQKTCKRKQSVLCFRSFPVAKNFMDKWGGGKGGVSIFSDELFSFHSAEKFHKETLYCFTKFGHLKK